MPNITYRTKTEAIAAGYLPIKAASAHLQLSLPYPPALAIKDSSGYPYYGYSYTLTDAQGHELAQSVTVWLTESTNKLGQPGAFFVGFRLAELNSAIEQISGPAPREE